MILYAIRHKATGKLMPQARKDRGYTNWEPTDDMHFREALDVPRLISSLHRAQIICQRWEAGALKMSWSKGSSWLGEPDEEYGVEPAKQLTKRTKGDLTIVVVKLSFNDEGLE